MVMERFSKYGLVSITQIKLTMGTRAVGLFGGLTLLSCEYVWPLMKAREPFSSVHGPGAVCPGRMTIQSPLTSNAQGRLMSCPSR